MKLAYPSASKLLIILSFIVFSNLSTAQKKSYGFSFGNQVTALPIVGYPKLFYSNFHPSIDFNYSIKLNKSSKNALYLSNNGAVLYHRFVQTLAALTSAISYHRQLNNRFNFNVGLGAGSGAAFEGGAVARLNDAGEYEVKSKFSPRFQYIFHFQTGITYALKKEIPDGIRLTAQFKTFLQGTFVKNYVPLLPINAFQVGVQIPLKIESHE